MRQCTTLMQSCCALTLRQARSQVPAASCACAYAAQGCSSTIHQPLLQHPPSPSPLARLTSKKPRSSRKRLMNWMMRERVWKMRRTSLLTIRSR